MSFLTSGSGNTGSQAIPTANPNHEREEKSHGYVSVRLSSEAKIRVFVASYRATLA